MNRQCLRKVIQMLNEYEYEQMECEKCHRITSVGYLENTGRIVCSKCASKQ